MASARPAKPPPPISTSIRSAARSLSIVSISRVQRAALPHDISRRPQCDRVQSLDSAYQARVIPRPDNGRHRPHAGLSKPRAAMSSAVQDLLAILDLERLEVNLFRGRSPQVGWQRVFGGQVIGQALVAACRTVDVAGRPPHSLHAYFLLGGDPKVPIIYEVDRIRDGKSFTTRRVIAIQHGQPIFSMSASFHREEPGLSHQTQMPDVPKPEDLPSEADVRERVMPLMPEPVRRYYERERPIELRPVGYSRYLGKPITDRRFNIWIRATGKLPDEPAIHQCVLAYASDMTLL